jgi:hypothetical protein
MNAAFRLRAYLEPRHYVRQARAINYCFDFAFRQVEKRRAAYGDNFCLILHGRANEEDDYFVIPYAAIKHLLTKENLSGHAPKYPKIRWMGAVIRGQLWVKRPSIHLDISDYYGNHDLLEQALADATEA